MCHWMKHPIISCTMQAWIAEQAPKNMTVISLPPFKRSQLFHTLPTQAIFKPPVSLARSDYNNGHSQVYK